MTIERNLERIANTLDLILQRYSGGGQENLPLNPTPTLGGGTGPHPDSQETAIAGGAVVVELTPAQKGAATKAANKLKREQDAAAAAAEPQLSVVATTGPVGVPAAAAAPPVGIDVLSPAPAEGESPALNPASIPTNLQEMTDYAKHVAAFLGPDVNKIGELLAGKYQVSRLPEMQIAHYTQFTADLRDLAQAKHAQSAPQ